MTFSKRLPQLLSFSNPPCHKTTQRKICQLLQLCGLAMVLVATFTYFVGCYIMRVNLGPQWSKMQRYGQEAPQTALNHLKEWGGPTMILWLRDSGTRTHTTYNYIFFPLHFGAIDSQLGTSRAYSLNVGVVVGSVPFLQRVALSPPEDVAGWDLLSWSFMGVVSLTHAACD